jgi:AP-1 complex subunit beta-1
LLEELLGEISSLASAYHKPEETFVGRGPVGADSVRKGSEYVMVDFVRNIAGLIRFGCSLLDERMSTQKALQTVAAGQQSENLL